MKYDKLVRDLIPDIITAKGDKAVIRLASDQEYRAKLREKLHEEVAEFMESSKSEELADIIEVVYALGAVAGLGPEQLEGLRKAKAKERGGFEKRVILEES